METPLDQQPHQGLLVFDFEDVELGALLGTGGFSSVYSFRYHQEEEPEEEDDSFPDKDEKDDLVGKQLQWQSGNHYQKQQTDHSKAHEREEHHPDGPHQDLTLDLTHPSSDFFCSLSLCSSASSTLSASLPSSSSSSLCSAEPPRNANERNDDAPSSWIHTRHKKKERANPELALKTLHCQTRQCPKAIRHGTRGLQTEVEILSSLLVSPDDHEDENEENRNAKTTAPRMKMAHPNIIQLVGVSADFWTMPDTAFIVLEKLQETLEDRLQRWKTQIDRTKPLHTNPLLFWIPHYSNDSTHYLSKQAQQDRIAQVMIPVASALAFLHEQHHIIFRDLKPQNIGFDAQNGTVKLLDFASARRLEPNQVLKSRSGTVRYMDPYVYHKKQGSNGYSADVYSFAMVLWEVCLLQKPYSQAKTTAELARMVCSTTQRPSLKHVSLKHVQELLSQCWNVQDPNARPSFATIYDTLIKNQQTNEQ